MLRVVSLSTARAPVLSLLVTGVRRAFVVVMGVLSLMRCPVVTPHSRMGVRGDLPVKSRAAQAPWLVLPLFTGSSFAAGLFNDNNLLQMTEERFAAGQFNDNNLPQMADERFAAGLFNINSLLQMADERFAAGQFNDNSLLQMAEGRFAAGQFNINNLLQIVDERFAAGLFNINNLLQMTKERFAAGLFNINSLPQSHKSPFAAGPQPASRRLSPPGTARAPCRSCRSCRVRSASERSPAPAWRLPVG